MSAFGSASSPSQGSGSPDGRPKVSPKYPSSMLATCLTSPSRLVPVGVSGRRTSYSESPSSLHSRASRPASRYPRSSAFGSGPVILAVCHPTPSACLDQFLVRQGRAVLLVTGLASRPDASGGPLTEQV